MLDTYFITVVVLGAVIIVKMIIIVCIYACRAKRRERLRMAVVERTCSATDASSYPTNPYTMQSPIMNFEETPQPIMTVSPDQVNSVLPPGAMQPPPYSTDQASDCNKPPSYAEAIGGGTNVVESTPSVAVAAQPIMCSNPPPIAVNPSGYPQAPTMVVGTPGNWIQTPSGGQSAHMMQPRDG